MKKTFWLYAATAIVLATGCLKDSAKHSYTRFRPIFQTKASAWAAVKSEAPQTIKSPAKLFILGNYIFLSEPYEGIHILDNSNPVSPVNKAFIPVPGNQDVSVKGTTLYADCGTDLLAIDISNPLQASLQNKVLNVFPERSWNFGVAVDSDHIIAAWDTKDTTITVDLPATGFWGNNVFITNQPIWGNGGINWQAFAQSAMSIGATQTSDGKAGSMSRLAIQNNRLYAVSQGSLNVIDIATPLQPSLMQKVAMGWNIETIYPFKDRLFIGSTTGMIIYSVANPDQPERLGFFGHANVCDPVIADDNFAYVTLRSGTSCNGFTNQLDVVDVQNLTQPSLIKSYHLTNPRGLSKDGNWLFVCDGKDGLKIMDAQSASNVTLKKTIGMAETFDVIAFNGKAIVTAKDGLYQYDYSNINNVKLLSKIGLSH